jgi:hypothetical protein
MASEIREIIAISGVRALVELAMFEDRLWVPRLVDLTLVHCATHLKIGAMLPRFRHPPT